MRVDTLLKDIFQSILNSFLNMVAQMIARWLVFQAVTSAGMGAGSFFNAFGFSFANGGIMEPGGPFPLRKYSYGGIANSAQMAVFGEGRRPEAYVPLPDGRSIPVTMVGGGAPGITVSQNITIGGTSETDISVIADKLSKATRAGVLAAVDLAKVNYKVGLKRAEETTI